MSPGARNNGGPTSHAPGFTPGPWHVFDPGPHDLMQVRGEPDEGTDGPKVCDINDIGGYLGDYEANARLIAAAPELYEALVEARRIISEERECMVECATASPDHDLATLDPLTKPYVEEYDAALVRIDAALAKARGGQ